MRRRLSLAAIGALVALLSAAYASPILSAAPGAPPGGGYQQPSGPAQTAGASGQLAQNGQPAQAGQSAPAGQSPRTGQPAAGSKGRAGSQTAAQAPPTQQVVSGASAGAGARNLGANGQIDPISGLGIRNPTCDHIQQIQDPVVRASCRTYGTPEGHYPASNYGFDIHIDSGIFEPQSTLAKGLVLLLNGLWLGVIFVLKLVMTVLGLAFGLNPFARGPTMDQISSGVANFYNAVTDPWLTTTVIVAGVWFLWRGLVQSQVARAVSGTLAGVAMLLVGLVVVHEPGQTVGQAAAIADDVAVGVISAPQTGSTSRPQGAYAEALAGAWSHLVEVPFAGLDFSDVKWAMGPPPAEAVAKADEKMCSDTGLQAIDSAVNSYLRCNPTTIAARFGKPQRVLDLYLRSSPGSPSRDALWDYFDNNPTYKPRVAAQGGDGVMTRLSLVILFTAALLGTVLLLIWLALRLFMQAAIAFVLLLATPIIIFFWALGDAGRRAFRAWGLTLLGAIVAKVIYAAFLSVVLLGIVILAGLGGNGTSTATGFLLSSAFTWAVFLKRAELVGWMSVAGDGHERAGRGLERLAAFQLGSSLATALPRSLTRRGMGAGGWARGRAEDKAEATRRTAGDALGRGARALGERQYQDAQAAIAQARSPEEKRSDSYRGAQRLVGQADQNQRRIGDRWTPQDLRRLGEQDRALLATTPNPADHAHRAGLSRAQFEALKGPDRRRAEESIERAIRRDKQRVGVLTETPGRVAGYGLNLTERGRQSRTGEWRTRSAYLRSLRRHRRLGADPPIDRRGISRGG